MGSTCAGPHLRQRRLPAPAPVSYEIQVGYVPNEFSLAGYLYSVQNTSGTWGALRSAISRPP